MLRVHCNTCGHNGQCASNLMQTFAPRCTECRSPDISFQTEFAWQAGRIIVAWKGNRTSLKDAAGELMKLGMSSDEAWGLLQEL